MAAQHCRQCAEAPRYTLSHLRGDRYGRRPHLFLRWLALLPLLAFGRCGLGRWRLCPRLRGLAAARPLGLPHTRPPAGRPGSAPTPPWGKASPQPAPAQLVGMPARQWAGGTAGTEQELLVMVAEKGGWRPHMRCWLRAPLPAWSQELRSVIIGRCRPCSRVRPSSAAPAALGTL